MHISARGDYAVRAAVHLASVSTSPTRGEEIASSQAIPAKYLESIMTSLRAAGLVDSRRGVRGGYWLARPAADITVADVLRAVDGPLASVRGAGPESVAYEGPAAALQRVWIATRTNLREVLEQVSLADIATADLPAHVEALAADVQSWHTRPLPQGEARSVTGCATPPGRRAGR